MGRFGLFLAFILIAVVVIHVEGKGGGRGGGGRGGGRSSGGRGGGGRGGGGRSFGGGARSYAGTRSAAYSRGVSRTTRWKAASSFSPSTKSKMKKAAVFAGGAYVGHKASSKIGEKFRGKSWTPKVGHHWDFDDWEVNAKRDGFLCRTDADCNWLDDDLECTDHEVTLNPASTWFGGNAIAITGKCQCEENFWWDNEDVKCQLFTIDDGLAWWAILLIVLAVLVALCCCCFCIVSS